MLIVTGLLQLGQNGTLELWTKAMPRQQEHISSFGPFQKKVCFEASRVSCVWSCWFTLLLDIPIASCDKSHTNSSTFLLSWACMILYLQDCLPMPGFSHKAYLCVCFACLIPRGFVLSLGAGVNCCQRVEKSHAQKSRNTISSHSWKQPGVLGLCFPAAFPIMSRMLG